MAFVPPIKQPQFADLNGMLAQSRDTDDATYQTIQILIDRLSKFRDYVDSNLKAINAMIANQGGVGPVGPQGPPGIIGTHHLTHETGGSDQVLNLAGETITSGIINDTRLSSNVVLENIVNQFIRAQRINNAGGDIPRLTFSNLNQPVDGRVWEIQILSGNFNIAALTDNEGSYVGPVFAFKRNGDFQGQLNASDINRGTVPDVNLTPNVLKYGGGYPGGTTNYLRADGTFSPPSSGVPSPHHTTHEPGGSDTLVNSVWTNAVNQFTVNQRINNAGGDYPRITMTNLGQPVDQKTWQILNLGAELTIWSLTDAESGIQGSVSVARNGMFSAPIFKEQGQAVPMGYWQDIPFNPASFTADVAPDTWTVGAGNVIIARYMVIGKTLTISYVISASTINAPSSSRLLIAVPAGFVIDLVGGGTESSIGYAFPPIASVINITALNYAQIAFSKVDGSGWGVGSCSLRGVVTFKIV
jgi:hypothetical protein